LTENDSCVCGTDAEIDRCVVSFDANARGLTIRNITILIFTGSAVPSAVRIFQTLVLDVVVFVTSVRYGSPQTAALV